MLSAIGTSAYSFTPNSATSTGGLEAQLARYQGQLADWIHCPSCNTPEGKEKIKEISDKISEIKQSIKSTEDAKQSSSSTINASNALTNKNTDKVLLTLGLNEDLGNRSSPVSSTSTGVIGSRLDIFA